RLARPRNDLDQQTQIGRQIIVFALLLDQVLRKSGTTLQRHCCTPGEAYECSDFTCSLLSALWFSNDSAILLHSSSICGRFSRLVSRMIDTKSAAYGRVENAGKVAAY